MRKTPIILFFVFLVLISNSFAAQPSVTVQSPALGIAIEYPPNDYYTLEAPIKLHWHIFNSSSGKPLIPSDGVNCSFHLYNQSKHIFVVNNVVPYGGVSDYYDWEISLYNNITKAGIYSYIFQCNNSVVGGFLAKSFEVVHDRNKYQLQSQSNDSTSGIAIMVFMMLIILGVFYLGFRNEPFIKHEWADLVIKRGAITTGIYLMVLNSAIAMTIAANSNLNVTAEMGRFIWFFGMAGYLSMLFLMIMTIFDAIKLYKIGKENSREDYNE